MFWQLHRAEKRKLTSAIRDHDIKGCKPKPFTAIFFPSRRVGRAASGAAVAGAAGRLTGGRTAGALAAAGGAAPLARSSAPVGLHHLAVGVPGEPLSKRDECKRQPMIVAGRLVGPGHMPACWLAHSKTLSAANHVCQWTLDPTGEGAAVSAARGAAAGTGWRATAAAGQLTDALTSAGHMT